MAAKFITNIFFTTGFLSCLFLPTYAAGADPTAHESANWIGKVDVDKKTGVGQVSVIHQLRSSTLPPESGWKKLEPPLKINLICPKDCMKIVTAVRYNFELGCGTYPTYELKEKIKAEDWAFAVPENDAARWADNNAAVRNGAKLETADLPSYEWERLYDKLTYEMLSKKPSPGEFAPRGNFSDIDLTNISKESALDLIRKNGAKTVNGVAINGNARMIFADVELKFEGKDKLGKVANRSYSVHRFYRSSHTGGFDEVPTPYASGDFWDESYAPNQTLLLNMKDQLNLALRISGDLSRSLYILYNFHGVPLEHNFEFGEVSCE